MKTNYTQPYASYWQTIWEQFRRRRLGLIALFIIVIFCLVGIYAPFLASSKPLMVNFQGQWYFPLFRYLFYSGFFTKRLDIFYNLLMFTFPLLVLLWIGLRHAPRARAGAIGLWFLLQGGLFIYFAWYQPHDPAASPSHHQAQEWQEELKQLSPYAQLNLVLNAQLQQRQQARLQQYEEAYFAQAKRRGQAEPVFPSLWNLTHQHQRAESEQLQQMLTSPDQKSREQAQKRLNYLEAREVWLTQQMAQLKGEVMPLLRPFHWEDDAGGDQGLNRFVSWWDLTRINRKDMVAALIFGIRVSLSVGLLAIGLALLIGIPVGAFSGYYGGKIDLITYRLIEIWESMPTFFMLLMIVAFLQNKSIFLVIAVIGLFGWTGFSRFIRGEFFRQKQLPYVEACQALGYPNFKIMFSQILPNAIPPLLTLIPFAIMGAITSEAGLSFLGLGEEGSNSWGVLMDEGRSAFPSESYLLWPPAILLTLLLVSIALVGDALRDALDPKMHTY